MLPILTWAYLRHLAVQYHAESPPPEPFGSAQLRALGASDFPCGHPPSSIPAAYPPVRPANVRNDTDLGCGFGARLERESAAFDSRLRSSLSGSIIAPPPSPAPPPRSDQSITGASTSTAFTTSMRFREQVDTYGFSISVPPLPIGHGVAHVVLGVPPDSHTVRSSVPELGAVGPFGTVNDVIGMNITPALSQVLLAPPATSGSGASIIAAVNGATDDNGTRGEEINSFYFYEHPASPCKGCSIAAWQNELLLLLLLLLLQGH
uniref:Uncharacterized protein n=1 Tax=Anopheles farauti TaxID=69004 RepID=A0A182QHI6_9DIPT